MSEATTQILYSGDPFLYPFPGIQEHWTAQLRTRAAEDLVLIAEAYAGFAEHIADPDPAADVEDFWESAARAAAAIRAAHASGRAFTPRAAHDASGWDAGQLARRIGAVATIEERRHGIDPLLMHPLLVEHGGRWMSLAGYTDAPGEFESEHDLVQLMLARAALGVERVVVKMAARKTGVFTLPLWPTMTAQDCLTLLMNNDTLEGWTFVRLAGLRDQFLIQDWLPMQSEYRLFVVDGEAVSGAGCIEEFTPYSRLDPDASFDQRIRRHRGNGVAASRGDDSAVVVDHELVKRYWLTGVDLAAQYGGTVTIDLAEADGQIVVVELNTLPNSGLYASDPDRVARALITAADRGYRTYSWASAQA